MDASRDLYIGQTNKYDKVPLDYSSPSGDFRGKGYELKNEIVSPVYEKLDRRGNRFDLPVNININDSYRTKITNFLYQTRRNYTLPTIVNEEVFVGLEYKLTKLESANNLIAYRGMEILPLDNDEVRIIIRKNFQQLQGSGIFKQSTVDDVTSLTPLIVTDKNTGITVASFKNGVLPRVTSNLFKVKFMNAVNRVQKNVKVPVNTNQFTALVSLCYDVSLDKLMTSKMLNVLNKEKYNEVASYFLDFSEQILPNGNKILNEKLFNRRLLEAELFSNINL